MILLMPKQMWVIGEISKITNLATNDSLNSKINETKGEIPIIYNLATTSLNAKINVG